MSKIFEDGCRVDMFLRVVMIIVFFKNVMIVRGKFEIEISIFWCVLKFVL